MTSGVESPTLQPTPAQPESRFWSVTTLLDVGMGKGEGIVNYVGGVVAQRAYDRVDTLRSFIEADDRDGAIKWLKDARWQKLSKAGDRGTKVHKLIEMYALGQTPKVPDDFLPYDVQVRRFLKEWRPTFEMAEAPVYHPGHKYAGTLDLILRLGSDQRRFIVDAKTTDKPPPEIDPTVRSRPPYPEVALQMCAYSRAELIGISPMIERNHSGVGRYYVYDPSLPYEPMPQVDGALALIVSPYDYTLTPVRIDDEVWTYFGHVCEVARWQIHVAKRVLGRPLAAPHQEVVNG